eukprot:5286925-Amphidinium_carterae.2
MQNYREPDMTTIVRIELHYRGMHRRAHAERETSQHQTRKFYRKLQIYQKISSHLSERRREKDDQ